MISVVIPLYNKAPYIAKTLTSVLEQTYAHFEVVVIDDGSTDGSIQIVEQLADARVRVIIQKHQGVSAARNLGVTRAIHPWIALLDADDFWAPTFLTEMSQAIENHPKDQLFASGRSRVFKNYIERYDHIILPKDGDTAKLNYFEVISQTLPPINASNVVFNKSLFEERGYFRRDQINHEDHDLWMRLAVGVPIVFINKALSFYNKNIENTQSQKPLQASDFIRYLQTMSKVYSDLTNDERGYFKRYYNRFCTLTYLKNEQWFTKKDAKSIRAQARPLLGGFFYMIISTNRYLFFWNVYKILKRTL